MFFKDTWTPEAQEQITKKLLEAGYAPEAIPNLLKEFERREKGKDQKLQQKLAAAGMTTDDVMKQMSVSPKEDVETSRMRFHHECSNLLPLLQQRADIFCKRYSNEAVASSLSAKSFPAVDLASGSSLGTVAMALSTLNPDYFPIMKEKAGLYWYPTEILSASASVGLERTKRNLMHQRDEKPLFQDGNGRPIYDLDRIELNGLKTVSFNGRQGQITGPDPKTAGRYGVQLAGEAKEKSFKKENIFHGGSYSPYGSILHSLQEKDKAKVFFQDLLDRVREIDVLKKATWSNVEEVYGKCAFVTCTNLLTQIGYRDPSSWKNTMELASQLLHVDGYLLQLDAVGYDQFGNVAAMKDFALSLGMELDLVETGTPHEKSGRMRKIMIWKKSRKTDSIMR